MTSLSVSAVAGTASDPSVRYLNRELSWLEFNTRVLKEAGNLRHPLLERLMFLSISGSNLDEFYMVRVSGLLELVKEGIKTPSIDGMTPSQQLEKINMVATKLMEDQQATWETLRKELSAAGIELLEAGDLSQAELEVLRPNFMRAVFPILTPLAVDMAHPFPFIPNLGFTVAFRLRAASGKEMIALVPVPLQAQRFLTITKKNGRSRSVALETAIRLFADTLFPGFEILASGAFRILRDSDVEIEEEAEDLILQTQAALRERRRGDVVRLKIEASMPDDLREFIIDRLKADLSDVVPVEGILGIAQLSQLIPSDRPDLRFKPFSARFPERIRDFGGDCFAAIKAKDILVHHPFESFDVVVQFLKQAAKDPNVMAIKQTLYRTSKQSPIVAALIEAAEAGKSVTALVELKARFDEEANLKWARDLERAGVHVVYGFPALKTHAKISLVIRREGEELNTYTHFGTGNYHPITARIYTDLSLFTADPALGRDAGRIFNYITGYAAPDSLERVLLSPLSMKQGLLRLIDAEIANARAGKPSGIWAKMNALVDTDIIDRLYEASNAGVPVDLILRGVCCLRPGVKGLSENIRVRSIVGRFLEHSRISCFASGEALPSAKAKIFISSADWMPRNLERRIETMVPVLNPTVHQQVLRQIMVANLADEVSSWNMNTDGSYTRVEAEVYEDAFSVHHYFMSNPSLSGRGRASARSAAPRKPGPSARRKKKIAASVNIDGAAEA